jgi:hypothetical protein
MPRHQQRWKGHLQTYKETGCIVSQEHTLGHPATLQAVVTQHLASILPVGRLSSTKAFGCAEIHIINITRSLRRIDLQFTGLSTFDLGVVIGIGLFEEGFGGDLAKQHDTDTITGTNSRMSHLFSRDKSALTH